MRWPKAFVLAGMVGGVVAGSGAVRGEMRPPAGQLAAIEAALPQACLHPGPPLPRTASWIRFGGLKTRAPTLNRSEAGVTLSLGSHVAVQLHYERTALAPTMHHDHDDGVLTRLRLAF